MSHLSKKRSRMSKRVKIPYWISFFLQTKFLFSRLRFMNSQNNYNMRTSILSLLVLVYCGIAYAQLGTGETSFDYKAELQRTATIPKSPEAAAFEKYGNTPVNLYTGTTNIGVPIYTHQGREMSLPISLSYDASGIKVNQMASQVGLGWNLNVGGRISRTVNGLPDDYVSVSGAYQTMYSASVRNMVTAINSRGLNTEFDTKQDLEAHFLFLEQISNNEVDAQPDFYSLSVPGLSDMIALDINNNMNPVAVNNPRIKITKTHGTNNSLNSWTVTGEDGTKYYFTITEQTKTRQDAVEGISSNIINTHNSSWLLTKIESPNKKDTYEFSYVSYGFWGQEPVGYTATVAINNINPYQTTYNAPHKVSGISMPYTIKQQFLTSIKHNGKVIVSNSLTNRSDTDGRSKRLNAIIIRDPFGLQIEKASFTYSYFGNTSSSNIFDKRLKLDKVSFSGKLASSSEKVYRFEYHQPYNVPSRLSLAQDKWGYYNGADGNTVLYPSYNDGTYSFAGANRDTVPNKAMVGLLTKIIYPTKGYSSFSYESNQVYKEVLANQNITRLATHINPNHPVDANAFLLSNGSICNDEYFEIGTPQIKLVQFIVPQEGFGNGHTIKGTHILRAAIARIGDIGEVTQVSDNLDIFTYTGTDTYTSYCNFNTQPLVWNRNSPNPSYSTSFSANISLTPGVYKAMVLSLPEDNATTYLTVHKQVTNLVGENTNVGGVRIQKIRDYSRTNVLASTREFNYNDAWGNSTGTLQFDPLFSEMKKIVNYGSDPTQHGQEKFQLERKAFSSRSSAGSHITYNVVKEYQLDGSGNKNGSTTYTFNQRKEGLVGRNGYPFQQDFWGGTLAGSTEKTETFNSSNTRLTEQSTSQYYKEEVFLNQSLTVYSDPSKAQHWLIAFKNANNKWQHMSMPQYGCGGGSDPFNPGGGTASYCFIYQNNPTSYHLDYGKSGSLVTASQYIAGQVTAPEVTISKETYQGQDIVTTTTNTFDPDVDHLIRTTTVTQKGEQHTTKFYYPKDINSSVHTAMVSSNRLAIPIKIEQYQDNAKLAAKNTVYKNYGSGRIQPERIQTAKGNNTVTTGPFVQEVFEDRMVIHSYYSSGNVKEVSQKDGSHTLFVWGYNHMYPIARIDNATFSGMPSSVTTLMNQATTLSNSENTASEEATLRNKLNELRNHSYFNNAQVTTYVYDPQVGIKSMTDARGYTTTYTYDSFNRLLHVKDQDNNILSKNEYNFK